MVILIVAFYFFRWFMFGSTMVRRLGNILRSANCSGFYTKLSVGLCIGWDMLFIVSSHFFPLDLVRFGVGTALGPYDFL